MPPRKEIEHGTHQGYKTHIRRAETACDGCREAWRIYRLGKEREKGVKPLVRKVLVEDNISHGTDYGYEQHRKLKTPTCKACRAAHAAAARRTRENPKVKDRERQLSGKRLRYGRVQLPLDLFVQLWYTADKKTLEAMDDEFGKERVDKWIKMNEEAQGASNV